MWGFVEAEEQSIARAAFERTATFLHLGCYSGEGKTEKWQLGIKTGENLLLRENLSGPETLTCTTQDGHMVTQATKA